MYVGSIGFIGFGDLGSIGFVGFIGSVGFMGFIGFAGFMRSVGFYRVSKVFWNPLRTTCAERYLHRDRSTPNPS